GTIGIVSGGKYAKYGCTNNWNKGDSVCQNKLKIEKFLLEESIINTLIRQLLDESSMARILEELYVNFETYFEASIIKSNKTEIEEKINQISVEINNLVNAIKMGIHSESIRKALIDCENKKRDLENKLSLTSLNTKFNVRELIHVGDIKSYFSTMTEKLINPESTFDTFSQL
ncbi:MAG: hypothetical protein N2511_08820, partial [Thermodesulfovibrionales bacterium]|nr:hypothetical protein [Thermodesulfovibrionales bacterium]